MNLCKKFALGILVATFAASTVGASAQTPVTPNPVSPASARPAPVTPAQIATTAKGQATLQNAASLGVPIAVASSVSDNASIQAVLIPASVAKKIFGKEVSQNYAVVEVIISNTDDKASLVVHSIFLDYSNWFLSGLANENSAQAMNLTKNQTPNLPSQVASVESRLVRGQLLDAQQWTARNWTMRSLVAVGSVAAGFQFPFSGDVARGIAAFNGTVVPGASALWPDGTVNQINRISDFGFQTNKIIPKQGSDIVVAFFPINRFLTPGFRKIFLKNPASLFVPGEMLADPTMAKPYEQYLRPLADMNPDLSSTGGTLQTRMLRAATADCSNIDANNNGICSLKKILNGISLNNIRVVLEGVMTVDVSAVPATIYSVDFDRGNFDASIWNTVGKQAGTITGVYLTGGVPAVVDANGKAIPGISITATADGATDTSLPFEMTTANCIDPTTKVYFQVNKPQDTGTTVSSATKNTGTAKKPTAASAKAAKNTVLSTPYLFPLPGYAACSAAKTDEGKGTTPKGETGIDATDRSAAETAETPEPAPAPDKSAKASPAKTKSAKKIR